MDKRTQSANSSAEDERNMFLVNSQASTLSTVQAIIGNKTYVFHLFSSKIVFKIILSKKQP